MMEEKLISNNKKALHDYFVLKKYECGIALKGTEVKSIRKGSCNIKESICKVINNEMFVIGMHINPYEQGNIFNVDSDRDRKLLLHKKQIREIFEELKLKGNTVVPLKVYFKNNLVKVEIGLCKGKKLYDKRHELKKKEIKRKLEQDFKSSYIKI